jgi:hypothetical protein
VDLPIKNGGSFHGYVSSPEGSHTQPFAAPFVAASWCGFSVHQRNLTNAQQIVTDSLMNARTVQALGPLVFARYEAMGFCKKW